MQSHTFISDFFVKKSPEAIICFGRFKSDTLRRQSVIADNKKVSLLIYELMLKSTFEVESFSNVQKFDFIKKQDSIKNHEEIIGIIKL